MEAIKFKNYTNEDFTWSYNAVPHLFKAGQEIYLEDFKAKHFAKHLVDRELNKVGTLTNNVTARAGLEVQCLPSDEPVSVAEAIDIEAKSQVVEKKKAGKPKKVEEEEFADLKK